MSEYVHLCKTNLYCTECPLYINGMCIVLWKEELEKNFHKKITIRYVYYYDKCKKEENK